MKKPRPTYGERAAARAKARAPLFAADPAFVKTPQEYEAARTRTRTAQQAALANLHAEQRRRVATWYRAASAAKRAQFRRRRKNLPPSPEFAADLTHQIDHGR